MSERPSKKKQRDTEPYTDVQSIYTVQWWDGVEWRSHHEFETAEEAVAASLKQNREFEVAPDLVYFTRPVKETTITTTMVELL